MKQAVVCFKGECSPSKPYIISYNVTWCHMMLLCRFVWRSGSHCWQSYHQSVSDVHRVVHDAPSRWTWRWIPSKTRSNWENTHPGHEDFWTCIWAPLKRITWRCVTLHNVTWFIFLICLAVHKGEVSHGVTLSREHQTVWCCPQLYCWELWDGAQANQGCSQENKLPGNII